MMYMEDGIEMETIFGDGSNSSRAGFIGALMGAGKRLLTGESLFMTVFLNRSAQKKKVAFGAPYPGQDRRRPSRARSAASSSRRRTRSSRRRRASSVGIAFQKQARRRPVRRRGLHHAAPAGRRLGVRPRRRHAPGTDAGAGRGAPRRHRLHRRVPAVGQLRHPVRRQDQVGAVRRRGTVLRHAAGPGPRLAAVAAAQPAGEPDHRRGAGPGRGGREEGSILGGLGNLLDGDN